MNKTSSAQVTPGDLEAFRTHVYRRTSRRRVQTLDQAENFVNEVGFCFFWPIKGVEMPSLFHAIAGRVRDVPMEHDDPDISKCWGWKDQSLGSKRWYYGKVLSRRAMMISREFLPIFYALSPNYGGDTDYIEEYEAGLLSREARLVFEALDKTGPMDTVRLRRECGLASDSAKGAFDRALVDLQVSMKILPIGVAEAGAWRYAFIFDLMERHFPEAVAAARSISRSEARARLIEQYTYNIVALPETAIRKVFAVLKWTPAELGRTLEHLHQQERLTKIAVEGIKGEQLASVRALGEMRNLRSRRA